MAGNQEEQDWGAEDETLGHRAQLGRAQCLVAATPSARNKSLGLAGAAGRAGDDCVGDLREMKGD